MTMSHYEQAPWEELEEHWHERATRRLLPPRAKVALDRTANATKDKLSSAGKAVADAAPESIKNAAGRLVTG